MPVGKASLGRVARASSKDAAVPETAATAAPVEKAPAKPAAEKKPAAKKPTEKHVAASCGNKIYAVGDALPEYLL